MTEILIDPSKSMIAVQVTSQSLHALGFEITVFASDGNTVIEQFTGDTSKNNPFIQKLQRRPSDYKGTYIRGIFTVMSPNGQDYPFSIIYSVLEDNILVNPNITISGNTTNGTYISIANYHLN